MPRFLRLPGARHPTSSSAHGGVWVGDVLILDADRRPTSAALLGLGTVVVLAFVVAFVLGTQAPRANGGTALQTAAAAATGTTGSGPATTSLRLDPVPALPDLRKGSARTRSPQPAQAAAPAPAPSTEPATTPTPAAPQPVQTPVTPSRPAPVAEPKPSPGPAVEKFDSSG